MMTQKDDIVIALATRHFLYQLLQRVFAHDPDLELLDTLTSDHTSKMVKLFIEENAEVLSLYEDLIAELSTRIQDDSDILLDDLKNEYTYLFIGPTKLPAPPWESVYISKERLIFQESTLKVRRAYLKYGFLPSNYPHEADDHLALELDFMVHLANLTFQVFEKGDETQLKTLLNDQKDFLQQHLLVWIGDFTKLMLEAKTSYLYPKMTKVTELILNLDDTVIDEILSLIK